MKINSIFQRLMLLLCILYSAIANAKNPPPLDSYAALPEASMMSISPDGSRYAYRYTKGDKDYLVTKDIKTDKIIGSIKLSEIDPHGVYFLDKDRLILRVSEYMSLPRFKGRHNVSTAFLYDIKEKEIRQLLTPGYGVYMGQTSLGSVIGIRKEDGKLLMPALYGDDRVDPVYTLMSVNPEAKREPRRVTMGTHDAIDFFVDEDGELLVQERYNNAKNLHRLQIRRDDEWVDLFTEETEIRHKAFVGLTPDRESIVMTMYDDSGRKNYYTMSLTDAKITGPLFTKKDADVESVLSDTFRVVYGIQYSGFRPSYQFFDKKTQATYEAIIAAMPDHTFTIADYTPDWKNIVFLVDGPEVVGNYILFANNQFQPLAAKWPNFTPEDYNPIEVSSFKARDGLTIPTLLTYPKVKEKKNLPTILMPHGGPKSYDRVWFDWLAQFLTSRGYLVIQPQFRGSDGFGADHIIAGYGEWGGKMQHDLTDAVDHYIGTGLVNKDKVCILGASYGGYAALAGGAYTPDKYQCVVSIAGVSDLEEMLDTEKRQYGSDHWVISYWEKSMMDKQNTDEFLENISPINFAKQFKAPVLLIHGERDKVVPFEQSDDIYDELDDEDKDVKLVELEDEGHHLIYEKSRLKLLQEIETFLAKHL